jgi:class 3 adenylate cyclase
MGAGGAAGATGELPAGTVAFLFTDLEGSTRLLQAHPAAYPDAVARHHAVLRGAVFEAVGDAVYAAFAQATDAVAASQEGQLALRRAGWGALGRASCERAGLPRGRGRTLRCPLRRGAAVPRRAAADGRPREQVVLTEATAALVRDALPEGAGRRDPGEPRLEGLARPERTARLLVPGAVCLGFRAGQGAGLRVGQSPFRVRFVQDGGTR